MSGLQAIHNRIVCKPEKAPEQTKGGIALPDNAKGDHPSKGFRAVVVAAGGGKHLESGKLIRNQVSVNDVVYISKMFSTEFEHDGEKYFSLHEEGILAVVAK
jgi:co-chaperonin GroES (HSP10)